MKEAESFSALEFNTLEDISSDLDEIVVVSMGAPSTGAVKAASSCCCTACCCCSRDQN